MIETSARSVARIIEVRRHSMRHKPGVHLSSDGISLARYASGTMGAFDRVITSDLPRASETAVAMGYAIDSTIEDLGAIPGELVEATGWPEPIPRIAENAQCSGVLKEFAERQAEIWRSLLDACAGDEQRVLIISHGAIMELGLLAAVEWRNVNGLGGAFAYCEGFRLLYEGQKCVSSELMRLPEARRLVEN